MQIIKSSHALLQDIVEDSSIIQPVIANPGSGTFVGSTTVTLSTTTANAEIFYTLDGKDPIEYGAKYELQLKSQKIQHLKQS